MNIEEKVYESLENILGVSQEELKSASSMNLFENKLINSLALVSLFTEISDSLNIDIDFSQMKKEDIASIDSIIAMIKRISTKK